VWSMRTTARREKDEWVVDGTKQWVSRGPYADYAVLFAVSDPASAGRREGGITALIVPMAVPGVRVESVTGLLGRVGGDEALLSFSGARVPASYVLGEPDQGAAVAASGTPTGALYTAGRFIGLGRWALERAIGHAKSHTAFGRTVSEIDAARLALADCAIELRAAETMAVACADLLEGGSPAPRETAMLRVHAVDVCARVYERCLAIHGGAGLATDNRLYDGWHQAAIVRTAEGIAQPTRHSIAQRLLDGEPVL